jgi:hypothetical protein
MMAEGLRRMLAFERSGSVKAVYLFAVSVATLDRFIDSLLPQPSRATGEIEEISLCA